MEEKKVAVAQEGIRGVMALKERNLIRSTVHVKTSPMSSKTNIFDQVVDTLVNMVNLPNGTKVRSKMSTGKNLRVNTDGIDQGESGARVVKESIITAGGRLLAPPTIRITK